MISYPLIKYTAHLNCFPFYFAKHRLINILYICGYKFSRVKAYIINVLLFILYVFAICVQSVGFVRFFIWLL